MNEIELKISQLIDNELNDAEQSDLFETLSQNKNARIAFGEFINVKRETAVYYSSNAIELDITKQIKFHQPEIKNSSRFKVSFYFSSVVVLVLVALLFFNQGRSSQLRTQINTLSKQNLLLTDQLVKARQTYISSKFQKEIKNEKSKKGKVTVPKKNDEKKIKRFESSPYNNAFQSNRVVVTNEDFIGGKIVAN